MTSPTGEELGYPAYCCPFCHERGTWRMKRYGDAVMSWACDPHLAWVLDSLQREREVTQVMVTRVPSPVPSEGKTT